MLKALSIINKDSKKKEYLEIHGLLGKDEAIGKVPEFPILVIGIWQIRHR